MPIDVEVSLVPMHPFPNPVSQPPHGKDVAGAIENQRIALVQAFTRQDFLFDREQARVVGLEWVGARHRSMITQRRRPITSSGDNGDPDFFKLWEGRPALLNPLAANRQCTFSTECGI